MSPTLLVLEKSSVDVQLLEFVTILVFLQRQRSGAFRHCTMQAIRLDSLLTCSGRPRA